MTVERDGDACALEDQEGSGHEVDDGGVGRTAHDDIQCDEEATNGGQYGVKASTDSARDEGNGDDDYGDAGGVRVDVVKGAGCVVVRRVDGAMVAPLL